MKRPNPRIKRYVVVLYIGSVLAFVIVKALLRPIVMDGDAWIGLEIFVLSFPNFVEAIVGMTNSFGLLLLGKHHSVPWLRFRSVNSLLVIATAVTAGFVLSQEFGLHHLGGENVTDLYDVIASVLGISMMVIIFYSNGFFNEQRS